MAGGPGGICMGGPAGFAGYWGCYAVASGGAEWASMWAMEDRLHDCRPGRSLYGRSSGVRMLLWEYREDLAVANLGVY